ncbi:hypothetical protein AB0J83_03310 [Actinoplanes sp. NPDC049596]|uniref:hypothetical protein n=1 Tax=unclassified Actinoplanes TaxID=2626549 RepID=UPI0034402117
MVVAASGFQSGALRHAQAHGIACVRLVDAWTYLSRTTSALNPPPAPKGTYSGYLITDDADGYDSDMLTGRPDETLRMLLTPGR